eukprot:scaffold106_cov380-Prasinococcus_capsulatus_cf.AAC.52
MSAKQWSVAVDAVAGCHPSIHAATCLQYYTCPQSASSRAHSTGFSSRRGGREAASDMASYRVALVGQPSKQQQPMLFVVGTQAIQLVSPDGQKLLDQFTYDRVERWAVRT